MCSRVDLPVPDGPISATISPGAIDNDAPRNISRRLRPCRKPRTIPSRDNAAGSLIAQRLDRIEPRRPPGRIDRRQQRQRQRHANNRDDLHGIDLGR